MNAFIVTARQAARMPRSLLLAVCLFYAVPGLVGRDPWRLADAAGFGIAWSFSISPWGATWLIPGVAGEPSPEHGPLPFWLAAGAMRLLPGLPADLVIRLVAMTGLLLLMAAVWYGLWELARRPRIQPADPFGASASPTDFGRSVADSGLLILLACVGLIARAHETTADTAQVVWTGIFLFACARGLERPHSGGLLCAVMIAASLLTRGIAPALALLGVLILLPVVSRGWRLVWRPFLGTALPVAAVGLLAWPLALQGTSRASAEHLSAWWQANLSPVQSFVQTPGPVLADWLSTLPWFLWPAWPIALGALWQWRHRRDQPAIVLPSLTLIALGVSSLIAPTPNEAGLLTLGPPAAMLAAFGLSTLRRSLGALIDWFAVMSFSLFGIALWLYWLAMQTGWPPRMAASVQRAVPGYVPGTPGLELALALAVTVAWGALVAWRLARRPSAIWRPVALSSGGLVLTWVLLMTLWLPAANHRNSYREVAEQAAARVAQAPGCVQTAGLDLAQRTAFAYHGGLKLASDPQASCPWHLDAVRGGATASARALPDPAEWTLRWQGQRSGDRRERFTLLQRVSP
jgi:4-amino-4-deoxy-L-arabinose transferase-like glycosyltransferase